MSLSGDGGAAEQVGGAHISEHTFAMLGEQAVLGRTFGPQDAQPDAPPTVLLSHALWSVRYEADPTVLGRSVKVNGTLVTIVGVMPRGMRFPWDEDLWLPIVPQDGSSRGSRPGVTSGRLADGVTVSQAQAEMATIASALAQAYPETNDNVTVEVTSFEGRDLMLPEDAELFRSLLFAVGFVLLIACANVSCLLLARGAHRSQEMSVRSSLGASRWRIVRQLLVEGIALAAIGGAVGLAFSAAGLRIAEPLLVAVNRPYWMTLTMDLRVLAFLVSVCLATGVLADPTPCSAGDGAQSRAGGVRVRDPPGGGAHRAACDRVRRSGHRDHHRVRRSGRRGVRAAARGPRGGAGGDRGRLDAHPRRQRPGYVR